MPYCVLLSSDKILTLTNITSSTNFTERQTGEYNGEPHFTSECMHASYLIIQKRCVSAFITIFLSSCHRTLKYDMHNEHLTCNIYVLHISTRIVLGISSNDQG